VDFIQPAVFILGLQLVGINLSGAIVFRLFGLTPEGPRYSRGNRRTRVISAAVTLAGLLTLVAWQFGTGETTLQRSGIERNVRDDILARFTGDTSVNIIRARVTFTRASEGNAPALLSELHIEPRPGAASDAGELRATIRDVVRQIVTRRDASVRSATAVTIIE
jgi:uncharacterized membrane protein